MAMVIELFTLIGEEIAANPTTFIIEVVQFFILIAIVYAVAWGFGKRRGMLRNMLTEHQARVARQLEEAQGAEQDLAGARDLARESIKTAKADARRQTAAARKHAQQVLAASQADVNREIEAMRGHANELLEMEREEMLANARERLLDVVGRATRYILSDGLSPAEQRSLIQHSIMESLNPSDNGSKTTKTTKPTDAHKSATKRPAVHTTAAEK